MSFLRRFTRPRTRVSLALSKKSFTLGEDMDGVVTVESDEEVDVKEIRVKLWCRESKKKTRIERDDEGNETQSTYWDTANLFYNNPRIQGAIHLASGSRKEIPFCVNIPAGGRESYYSVDASVKWFLAVSVDFEGRRGVNSETYETQVTKPSAVPTVIKEKEIVTREVVMIPCAYCGGLTPQTSTFCPNCGARRKA